MDYIAIIVAVIAFLAGLGLGAGGYRYYLKRNPLALEKLAGFVRDAKDAVGRRFE